MGKHDGYKMLALRVQNMTRSCILLKKFKKGTWSLPVVTIPSQDDAGLHLNKVIDQVYKGDGYEFISAVSILTWMQEDRHGVEHHSIIYDLRYSGKILPYLTDSCRERFTESKWVHKGMLDKYLEDANYPLFAYITAAEKEKCLS